MSVPAETTALLQTPLNALHLELGARMVPFAGYSMPVQYPEGLMAEHHHTRRAAGLFDVSHMGQLLLSGPEAAAAFESLMPVDVIGLWHRASAQAYPSTGAACRGPAASRHPAVMTRINN